jgi:hypothetical protein
VAAWSLAGFTVLVPLAALVLLALNASRMDASRIGAYPILAVTVGFYAATGSLIISRLPSNAIGWLLSLIGLLVAASMLSEQYALYGLATAPGSVPAARLAGWCSGTLATLGVAVLFFLVLLFPDGRLPSRRWRPVLWAMFAVVAGWVAQQLQIGATTGGLTNALYAAGVAYPNPLGIFPRHGWFSSLLAALLFVGLATGVLAVVSVFVRRHGASAELRKQLAWLGYVGLMTAMWAAVLTVFALAAHGANGWLGTLMWDFLVLTPVAGIPLACAVAVLKYGLYEIDRVISRTLAYAIITGLLIGVYAGLVLLATRVLSVNSPVAVAASTLAAAALFTPLRSWVQRMVDRRFNRARYDADQTVAAFAARLQDAVDLDSVRDDLASVVQKTLEPAHISVCMSERR